MDFTWISLGRWPWISLTFAQGTIIARHTAWCTCCGDTYAEAVTRNITVAQRDHAPGHLNPCCVQRSKFQAELLAFGNLVSFSFVQEKVGEHDSLVPAPISMPSNDEDGSRTTTRIRYT